MCLFSNLNRFVLVCVAALAASHASADSISLTSSADTAIYGQSPDDNAGGNDRWGVGANTNLDRSHGLVKFNLAGQIPANASIQSVTLTLTVVKIPNSTPVNSIFDLHRMLVTWNEGIGTGGGEGGRTAVAGEVSWNHRVHPSTNWSVVGAAAPVDFSSTVSGSQLVGDLGTYVFASTPQMVADVNQWLSNSATNFGWLLNSESETTPRTLRFFGSRENTTVANRPVLTIQYVVPVTPVIKSIKRVGGTVQFTFNALAGQPYTAEYRDSLVTGAWQTLTTINPQPSTMDVTVTDFSPPASKRFYRITTTF